MLREPRVRRRRGQFGHGLARKARAADARVDLQRRRQLGAACRRGVGVDFLERVQDRASAGGRPARARCLRAGAIEHQDARARQRRAAGRCLPRCRATKNISAPAPPSAPAMGAAPSAVAVGLHHGSNLGRAGAARDLGVVRADRAQADGQARVIVGMSIMAARENDTARAQSNGLGFHAGLRRISGCVEAPRPSAPSIPSTPVRRAARLPAACTTSARGIRDAGYSAGNWGRCRSA